MDRMDDFRSPRVMGIVNCTPDSFYPGSRTPGAEASVLAAMDMIRDGADIIDVGGESTRPGSGGVSPEEQIDRVVPAIRGIRARSSVAISVDTMNARVAEAALDAGADIINDVSAFESDPSMAALAAERDVPVVLMHKKGSPKSMQDDPTYVDVVREVRDYLLERAEVALAAGVRREKVILDPGIGFGKRPEDNASLLNHLDVLKELGFALLVGLSRKSFLGLIGEDEDRRAFEAFREGTGQSAGSALEPRRVPPEERSMLTAAAHSWCLAGGADILRVHDVRETRQIIAVWEALSWAS
jgi:dihydropteroate synthase